MPDQEIAGFPAQTDLLDRPLRSARLPNAADLPSSSDQPPRDAEYEVVRKLDAGAYASVYLVREVVDRPLSNDGYVGSLHMDGQTDRIVYGKEYREQQVRR